MAFLIGLVALIAGALVYTSLRPSEQTYFIRYLGIERLSFDIQSNIVISIGYRLPAFLHVFSFALITASFFEFNRKKYLTICSAWLGVDTIFELGQKYKSISTQFVPKFFDNIPFFQGTYNYFHLGTFDYVDLIAYVLGALAAYFYLITSASKV